MTIFAITLLQVAILLSLTFVIVGTLYIQGRRLRLAPSKAAAPRDVYRM